MARPPPKPEPDDGAHPLNPAAVLRRSARRLLPPAAAFTVASHLVPLLVCLSLIPLVLLFSLFSGWYIWKSIPLAWQLPIYLQYGDGPVPYAELALPALSTAQPYDVSLHLVLPASEANFALGNFMASLSLSTPSNKTLLAVSRPAIALPPRRPSFPFSGPSRLIDLDVPLLSSYVPSTSRMNARIDLGRRDGWKSLGNGEGRELSVWDATLRGVVIRHGILGLVSRFPLTFAIGASAAFFSLSVIMLAACILPAVRSRTSTDGMSNGSEPREDRPSRFRKRSRRSVAGESRVVYKSEDAPAEIPSGHASDEFPLKRRRSRMSDVFPDSES